MAAHCGTPPSAAPTNCRADAMCRRPRLLLSSAPGDGAHHMGTTLVCQSLRPRAGVKSKKSLASDAKGCQRNLLHRFLMMTRHRCIPTGRAPQVLRITTNPAPNQNESDTALVAYRTHGVRPYV